MSFWDSLENILTTVGEMNNDATSDAAKLSDDELCYKVNTVNILVNPLIYGACSDELRRRAKKMSADTLQKYFIEYCMQEKTDAQEIFMEELKNRGLWEDE